MADTYAIIESGGKQYRAEKGATLLVDRLPADEGAKVDLRAVMFRGDKDVVLEAELEKVKVEARSRSTCAAKRSGSSSTGPRRAIAGARGHRPELTRLEVTEVRLLTRKPAAKAEPSRPTEKEPEAEASRRQRRPRPAKAKPRKPKAGEEARGEEAARPRSRPRGSRPPRSRRRQQDLDGQELGVC